MSHFRSAFFGGSFDPVHLGHLRLVEEVSKHYPWETFWVVPAYKNPHKDQLGASPSARLKMLELSLQEMKIPNLKILQWEINNPGPSYTLTTVQYLLRQSSVSLTLVLGNEVFEGLPRWHGAGQLLKLVDVLVVEREPAIPFDPRTTLKRVEMKELAHDSKVKTFSHSGNRTIESLEISVLRYSSTALRDEIATKWKHHDMEHPPQGIQRSVWEFIKENHLYAVT